MATRGEILGSLRKQLLRKRTFVAATVVAIYTLLGFLLVPYLVKRQLTQVVERDLGLKVAIKEVDVNPYTLTLVIAGFRLRGQQDSELLGFDRLRVNFQLSSLLRWAWTFAEVRLERPSIHVEIAADGTLNLLQLAQAEQDEESECTDCDTEATEQGRSPPRMLFERIQIVDGQLALRDLSGKRPAEASFEPINLEVEDLTTLPGRKGPHSFAAVLPGEGTFEWEGEVSLEPPWSKGKFAVRSLRPAAAWRFFRDQINLEKPEGTIDLEIAYRFAYRSRAALLNIDSLRFLVSDLALALSEEPQPVVAVKPLRATLARFDLSLTAEAEFGADGNRSRLNDVGVTMSDFALLIPSETGPLLTITKAELLGGDIDVSNRAVSIKSIGVNGGRAETWLETDGRLNWAALMLAPESTLEQASTLEVQPPQPSSGSAWSVAVSKVSLQRFQLGLADRSLSTQPLFNLDNIELALTDLHTDPERSLGYRLALDVREGGRIAVAGQAKPRQARAEATLEVAEFALPPLQAYLDSLARLSLDSGQLSVKGELEYGIAEPDALRFTGDINLGNLELNESGKKSPLLAWRSLDALETQFTLAPDKLTVATLRLREPSARFIIHEDKSLNVQKVLRSEQDSRASKSVQEAPKRPTPPNQQALFPVLVRQLRVEDGVLDFADLSLRPQFAAKIHTLNGAMTGLSSAPGARAALELEGHVDEHGFALIQGEAEPLSAKSFTDIALTFRNVEMSTLTPYSAKFAGYTIDSGKLGLKLQYRVNKKQLDGNNQVVLDRLELGDEVESEDALNVPLRLAVAILRDADGRIDIGFPVTGNVDSPEFNYGHVVWRALGNFLLKIVVAPFRAIGQILGISGEDLNKVGFPPGRFELLPPEQEKLNLVAKALLKRPLLALEVQGLYDLNLDGQAQKSLALRREVAVRSGTRLNPGEKPGPLSFTDEETQEAIEAIFVKTFSEVVLAQLEKTIGPEAQRDGTTTHLGAPLTQAAFYEELVQRIVEKRSPNDDALRQLAEERARAIVAHLTVSASVAPSRITTLAPTTVQQGAETETEETDQPIRATSQTDKVVVSVLKLKALGRK